MAPLATLLLAACASGGPDASRARPERPNLVFILADDLGYGELGSYGQTRILTPRLDRMAGEGLRFTQFYAGSTVCAPSRSVLMTGQHSGHTHVRGNAGGDLARQTLRREDVTLAELLQEAGYSTAVVGKWSLGETGTPGHPLEQGFDHFFGYLNQVHAHNYYPEFLWRGRRKLPLRNVVQPVGEPTGGFQGGYATRRVDYSPDLMMDDALRWVRKHRDGPFFLYLPLTLPHANNEARRATGNGAEVPDLGPYAELDWPQPDKGHAAMISRMDRDVGRLQDLLVELGIERRTLVIFSSDNGPHNESGQRPDFFASSGPLRGRKRSLTEGGIRVPTIAWWPGRIEPGRVSDHLAYFGDWLATARELAGVDPRGSSPELDSLSFVPTLLGGRQPSHEYLYWEFHERGSIQAVRFDRYKAIRRPMLDGRLRLYDLETDPGELRDIASSHPEVARRAATYLDEAHRPHPNWPVP